MSRQLPDDARNRALPEIAPSAVGASAGTATRTGAGAATSTGNATATALATADGGPVDHEDHHAALLPSPATTAAAVGVGGGLGFATVYSLASQHVDPLLGVAVIVALFAIAVLGLKSLTDARTEPGRAVAVSLNALATGATVGGLTVLL